MNLATETDTGPEGSVHPILEIRNLGVTYQSEGRELVVFTDISLEVRQGEFICIVGPSGCGKTTLIKCLAGLRRPTSGQAVMSGQPITSPPAGLSLVSQEYSRSLMPWLRVRRNVTFPLSAQGVGRAERDRRADAALAEVGLAGLGESYPWQLSGGMQQRVAIARATAYRPALLLMDEPFASVDAQARADLEDLVLRVQRHTGVTIVLVTHDIDEAVYLADRVIVLTKKPTTVNAIIPVDLGIDRDQLHTRSHPTFIAKRSQVWQLMRSTEETPSEPNLPGGTE